MRFTNVMEFNLEIRYVAIMLLFCIDISVELNINIDAKQGLIPLQLIPKVGLKGDRIETIWNIESQLGSRIKVYCMFYGTTCDEAEVLFTQDGSTFGLCPTHYLNYTYITINNRIDITIKNRWHEAATRCEVTATKPYLNQPEIIIDSSEYGKKIKHNSKRRCRCGWANKNRKRIVGGKETSVNEYPFIAVLFDKYLKVYFCGGTVITKRHILTAAHCTRGKLAKQLAVNIGEHDIGRYDETKLTKRIDVELIINHPHFNSPRYLDNDVAVLVLDDKIRFDRKIGPVCMPKEKRNLVDEHVKILGWGLIRAVQFGPLTTTKLMSTYLRIIDFDVCKVIYKHYRNNYDILNGSQLCMYGSGKGACQGDSGGPVLHLNKKTNMFELAGIISFSKVCASIDPSAAANVPYYMGWIKDQIKATVSSAEICSQ